MTAKINTIKACYEAQLEKAQEDAAHWKQEYDGAMGCNARLGAENFKLFAELERVASLHYPSRTDFKPSWDLIAELKGNKEPRCFRCGTSQNVYFDADPFASEIYNDHTNVYQCSACAADSAGDV